MYKLFITRIPFNKKLLYEVLVQFAPVEDFYYDPDGKFAIVSYRTKKDLLYSHEMLSTIRRLKTEISQELTIVEVRDLDPSLEGVFKKMMGKFGSVKFRKGCLFFKKEESALRAIENCNGRFVGDRKIRLTRKEEYN